MPIEEVQYKCGHLGMIGISSSGIEERFRILAWNRTSMLCKDCWLTKRTVERDKQRIEDKDFITKYAALPDLLGSEKQIFWADEIRAGILSKAERYVDALSQCKADDAALSLLCRHYPLWYADICQQRDAKWWIDKHNQTKTATSGKGYFARVYASVLDGGFAQNVAIILWSEWLAEQPDVIAYWERMQIKTARFNDEYMHSKAEHIKNVLACLDRVDWQLAVASKSLKVVSDDGHIITVAHSREGIAIEAIDGNPLIEFKGEFACRIDLRPEVLRLNTHLSAMWTVHHGEGTQKM